jgi:hypothetical protein
VKFSLPFQSPFDSEQAAWLIVFVGVRDFQVDWVPKVENISQLIER